MNFLHVDYWIWGKKWPCWIFHFSRLCGFRCLFKWPASEGACSHWLHLFDFSPLCIFSCFHCLIERMQSYIGCICLSFPLCVFSNVSSTHQDQSRYIHTGCIGLTFLHCVFSDVSSNDLPDRMHGYTGNICLTFSTVHFQMSPQIACRRGCTFTLVALVCLFSTVLFQMCP